MSDELTQLRLEAQQYNFHYTGYDEEELRNLLDIIKAKREGFPIVPCFGMSYEEKDRRCQICQLKSACEIQSPINRLNLPEETPIQDIECGMCGTGVFVVELKEDNGEIRDYGCSTPSCLNTLGMQCGWADDKLEDIQPPSIEFNKRPMKGEPLVIGGDEETVAPKKKKETPTQTLKRLLFEKGMSIEAFAKEINMEELAPRIEFMINNNKPIRDDLAIRLEEYFGISVDYWTRKSDNLKVNPLKKGTYPEEREAIKEVRASLRPQVEKPQKPAKPISDLPYAFKYKGQVYKTLSTVVRISTGNPTWSGNAFFKTNDKQLQVGDQLTRPYKDKVITVEVVEIPEEFKLKED